MSDKPTAEQWMRKNKSILPGPLTDGDWEQIRALLEKYAAELLIESEQDSSADVIPGVAGESPCAGCGKGMDGAFEQVVQVGGMWYHAEHAPSEQASPPLEPGEFFIIRGDGVQERCRYVGTPKGTK